MTVAFFYLIRYIMVQCLSCFSTIRHYYQERRNNEKSLWHVPYLLSYCNLRQITYAEGDSLAKSFLETIKDWPEPAELSKCAVMRWSCSSDCQIVYSSKNFVSYVITYQEYTGGAHNNYKTRVGTLMKGKQLRLKKSPLEYHNAMGTGNRQTLQSKKLQRLPKFKTI